MAKVTIGFALALILLGVLVFAATGARTSLIPAYVGVALGVCGLVALKAEYRKLAMHVAVVIGLIGFVAAAGRLIGSLARGTTPTTAALVSLILMALLTGIFVALGVRSFLAARRQRAAGFDILPKP